LIRGNSFLILDLRLDIVDGIGRFDIEGNGLARQRLHKDLHTTAETQNQVEGRLFLNIVVGQGTTVLELLTSEDETLLIRGNSFLILDLRLDIVDGIRRLDIKSDGFTRQSFHENLKEQRRRKSVRMEALSDTFEDANPAGGRHGTVIGHDTGKTRNCRKQCNDVQHGLASSVIGCL